MLEIKNGKLLLYMVDRKYLNHLSKIDKNVRFKADRKYYGIIVTNNNIDYCIPLTCKIRRRNEKLTINIKDSKNENTIAQLTLNNMIPVHTSLVKLVDVDNDIDRNYLISELRYLRKPEVVNGILEKSQKMLDVLSNEKHHDYSFFKGLCGDFKMLEQECVEWIKNN